MGRYIIISTDRSDMGGSTSGLGCENK